MRRTVFSLLVLMFSFGIVHAQATTFSSNLFLGSSGVQVLELQQVLNSSSNTRVALSGPGSPGEESEYFGLLTEAAVMRFQQEYASQILTPAGLTRPNGFVGAYTRAVLNSLSNGTMTTPTNASSAGCGPGALFNALTGQPCSTNTQTTPISSLTASPSGTTIPGVAEIVDSQGNVWTESNGSVYRNSVPVSESNTFSSLLFSNGTLYQDNTSCQWWYWNGSVWAPTADPTPDGSACLGEASPTPINGACGASNGIVDNIAPTTDLCSTGSASAVTGSGPWSWSCLGSYGGVDTSCVAGAESAVISGFCGSANGIATNIAPSTNLCRLGYASGLTGNGPWSWTCGESNGGSDADCSAPVLPTQTAALSANGTTIPSASRIVDNALNVWTINDGVVYENGTTAGYSADAALLLFYNGTIYQENSSQDWWSWTNSAWVASSDPRLSTAPIAVNGDCGASNGITTNAAPTTNLCSIGSATAVSGSGPWSWNCTGSNGGNTMSCVAATASTVSSTGSTLASTFAGWFGYRNDKQITGQNLQETTLTPSNVNQKQFGKVFSCAVDGQMYAEPLYVANINVGGKVRNVVYVATENDSVYAFDADDPNCTQLWHVSLGTPAQAADVYATNPKYWDLQPIVGITGTPVIDPSTNTLYVDAFTKDSSSSFVHRLHAIDLVTGKEKFGGPVVVNPSGFDAQKQLQRPGLLLANGNVYVAYGSYGDQTPSHGWVVAYNASNLSQVAVFNATPNGELGSVWQSGASLSSDASGDVYFLTANGDWNGSSNYGMSIMKMSPALKVLDYFTPSDQDALSSADEDLGTSGAVLLPDQAGPDPHELVGTAKNGSIYVVNRDNMTHFHSGGDQIVQEFDMCTSYCFFSSPGYWNNNVYIGAQSSVLKAYTLVSGQLVAASKSSVSFAYGPSVTISSNGTSNGIVWALDDRAYQPTTPAILYAFDATNLSTLLYASNQNASRDTAGNAVKFTVPTVANGKVYVGGNGSLTVYGLLP
jgi:hypothetical protein